MMGRMFKMVIIGGLAAVMLTGCYGRIETGHVGVRTDFNKKIDVEEVPPGFYGAVFSTVDDFVAKEIEIPMDDLTPKAKDNLSLAELDVSIFYVPTPGKIADMVVKYSGMSPKAKSGNYLPSYVLIERYTRGAVYDTVAQFDSLTIHTKRGVLEAAIKDQIQSDLDKSDPGAFTITKVIVRQLKTDPALERSIQQAVQVQKEIEAKKQQVELAVAEAERLRVESEGQAKANNIIAQSVTDRLLQLRQIEAMRKFAGDGTHTVLLPTDTKALVSIGK